MKIVAIIPARMRSSRFPGKPMKKINGTPMIEIIYNKVNACKFIDKTIVATCDYEIKNHIKKIGGTAIMTSKKHQRASDRCGEALKKYERSNKVIFDIVVMVQGDEPMINQKMIKQSLLPIIRDKKVQVVNLFSKIKSEEEFHKLYKENRQLFLVKNWDAYYAEKCIGTGVTEGGNKWGKFRKRYFKFWEETLLN